MQTPGFRYHASMNQTSTPTFMRHVIAAMVTNEPGVLSQVAGMFAAAFVAAFFLIFWLRGRRQRGE